mmetsp:Transcript_39223/g.109105  ORF Transcript_39223/g.109105 Transcript_39223/m.109105 type:complete len:208 (-) Transcript_39223:1087-1710(-)
MPEAPAAVAEAVLHELAHGECEPIEPHHGQRHSRPPEPTGVVRDAREKGHDTPALVEAKPVAWDEEEPPGHEAVGGPGVPPAQGVVGKILRPGDGLEGAEALRRADGLRPLGKGTPAHVEVHEAGECEPDQRGHGDVRPLQPCAVGSHEGDAHVNEGGQEPHGPVEVGEHPDTEEDELAVGQGVGVRASGLVKAREEGERRPTAAAA